MFKIICILVCMFLALFGSSQSTSFNCQYKHGGWDSLGTFYFCEVQNFVNITSLDEVHIDSINGTHLTGYSNDNGDGFYIDKMGQIHYFPRGLNKFFKDLKGIQISDVGLKVIHQSDLKDFPNLRELHLEFNNLEIIEKNLFEFNLNLKHVYLYENKISHIDANVFDKLTKLTTLYLDKNTCIDMDTDEPTEVLNIIRTVKSNCTNSDYSKLAQKVKNLEIEAKNLNSQNLKEKLENLENEVKNSKFPNFFQDQLQVLKSVQALKAQEETTTQPRNTTTQALFGSPKSTVFDWQCSYNEFEDNYYCEVQNINITSPEEAQVYSILGNHKAGYNDDNVDVFQVWRNGQIHYFPRGLNKFFKNLIEIDICDAGLKEIHQSDLRDFPNLRNLYLISNELEMLEKNLFEFNPNLKRIDLSDNKISYIDSNVFDKLRLKELRIESNTCIHTSSYSISFIFEIVKSQCIGLDYIKLREKVIDLEIEARKV